MKYCAVILSFGSVPYLPRAIEALGNMDIFILNPNRGWWSDKMVDKTEELSLGKPIIKADLNNETDARNYAKKWAEGNGYDVMIMPDSDEVIGDINALKRWIETREHDAYCCEIQDYYPDEDTLLPKRGHCPIIAIRLNNDYQFTDKRCYNGNWETNNKIIIHHYSLLIDSEKKFKIEASLYDDAYPPVEYKDLVN
jgi:hypothetical protein